MKARAAFAGSLIFLVATLITGCAVEANKPAPTRSAENNALLTPTPRSHPLTPSPMIERRDNPTPTTLIQEPAQTPTPEPARNEAGISIPPTSIGEDTNNQVATSATSTQPSLTQVSQIPTEPAAIPAQDCEDEAVFYADVTVPDGTWFSPGATFTKTWQISNTGSCTWEGYSLVFAYGDVMSAPLANPLPAIAPGDIVDVSIAMIAPTRGGEQTGNWEFQNTQGNRFGVGSGGSDYIWVQINVEWQGTGNNPAPVVQPSTPVVSPENCAAAPNADFESQVLSMINAGRTEQGLAPLVSSLALSNAARVHSQDMACQDFVDHDGSDGSTWYDRVANQGYANANSARENIYVGNPAFGGTPAGAYAWWMNSPVHRDNILNPSVSEIGIGYVYNQGSEYGGYYTVVFARP